MPKAQPLLARCTSRPSMANLLSQIWRRLLPVEAPNPLWYAAEQKIISRYNLPSLLVVKGHGLWLVWLSNIIYFSSFERKWRLIFNTSALIILEDEDHCLTRSQHVRWFLTFFLTHEFTFYNC
jgi:hypothetical protein